MAWALHKRFKDRDDKSGIANNKEHEVGRLRSMSMRLPKKATLGDLIAAVTEEVSPLTRGSANTNILVSYILRDLFAMRRVRLKKRRILKMA